MNIKNIFSNMNKKLLIYSGIILGIVILFFAVILIIKSTIKSKISPNEYEIKLKVAAEEYYKKYPKKLPKNSGEKISVSIDELVNSELIKSSDEALKDGVTCKGQVNVSNNNGYYLYQPIIKCSNKYETKLLYSKVFDNNKIKTSGDGLYKINDYYLFRGEKVNNYVEFANKKWRILRINNDNTLRLIMVDNLENVPWDDRYNIDRESDVGKNTYTISRMKETLDNLFVKKETKIFTNSEKSLIVPSALCIGARGEEELLMDGSIECKTKLDNQPIGLLQANEFPIVSLDEGCKNLFDMQCSNYNYLSELRSFWTITANSKNTYTVYRVAGNVSNAITNSYSIPRIVLNISSDALYTTGNGTENNPYIIK